MAKQLRCADVGMDCDYVATADSTDELMGKVVAHAKTVHGISEITPDLQAKVASVIRTIGE